MGEYHLGEFVNAFRHGSLVMRLPDTDAAEIPTVIFGTVNGVIGVVASLPQELSVFLHRLQGALTKTVKGVGGCCTRSGDPLLTSARLPRPKTSLTETSLSHFWTSHGPRWLQVADRLAMPLADITKRVEELTRLDVGEPHHIRKDTCHYYTVVMYSTVF